MISAIILARCNSSRLPNKHFYKIGDKRLIDINIQNLLLNKLIKNIYLGTGNVKENIKFKKYLDKNYKKKINIYFHKNSENVTERIYYLTKKINTKYTVLISGDCCLVDNNFITRLYNQLTLSNKDFIKSKKKLIHEGITLFRTQSWKKVYESTSETYQKEHPGYVVKEYPKLFNICDYKPLKYEIGKNLRLSIDTESDLNFFNSHYYYLKDRGKNFNLKNVIRSNNFNFLNAHVMQKKASINKEPKICIITMSSKKVGIGHLSRSKVLLREINETISSNVKLLVIGKKLREQSSIYQKKIKFISKLSNSLFYKYEKIILDLPKKNFDKVKDNLLNRKNVVVIDNYRNLKNTKFIIPCIRKIKSKNDNLFSGKDFLILSRDILKERRNIKKTHKNLLFLSGSGNLNNNIFNFLKKNKKNTDLIIGPLISKNELQSIKKNKINFIINPENIFNKIVNANDVYCKFGVSTFEIIALNKKPIVFNFNEKGERKKDINTLYKLGLIKIFKNNKLIFKKSKLKIDINFALKNIINVINSI